MRYTKGGGKLPHQKGDTMNIFFVNQDPKKAAAILYKLDPVRARKQIVELAQMFACIFEGDLLKKDGMPYKKPASIANHPATQWLMNKPNFNWGLEFMFWLICNATGGKEHSHGCYAVYQDLNDSVLFDMERVENWRWDDVKFVWITKKCPQLCEDIFAANILYIKLKQQGYYGN